LAALERKQCPAYLVRIIASFLQGRKATLSNGSSAFSADLYAGCPQGSVLSAFLWLVLVDEVLALQFDFTHLTLAYADDLTLAVSHRDPAIATAHLQTICAEVTKWTRSVELTINAQKTTFMIFSRSRSRPQSITLSLEGQSILPVRETQFLGLLLDQRLSWFPHVRSKCLNVKKLIFAVKRHLSVTWGLSKSVLKKLYTSTIEPTLLYGCSIWCPVISQARAVAILRSTQRLVAQIMLRTFKSSSTKTAVRKPVLYSVGLFRLNSGLWNSLPADSLPSVRPSRHGPVKPSNHPSPALTYRNLSVSPPASFQPTTPLGFAPNYPL